MYFIDWITSYRNYFGNLDLGTSGPSLVSRGDLDRSGMSSIPRPGPRTLRMLKEVLLEFQRELSPRV